MEDSLIVDVLAEVDVLVDVEVLVDVDVLVVCGASDADVISEVFGGRSLGGAAYIGWGSFGINTEWS